MLALNGWPNDELICNSPSSIAKAGFAISPAAAPTARSEGSSQLDVLRKAVFCEVRLPRWLILLKTFTGTLRLKLSESGAARVMQHYIYRMEEIRFSHIACMRTQPVFE